MNNSEQITVSLEVAKRLKEAGWEDEETQFWWVFPEKKWSGDEDQKWQCVYDGACNNAMDNNAGYTRPNEPLTYSLIQIEGGNEYSNDIKILEKYAAPTAEEILRELPSSIQVYRTRARENGWTCAYAVQGILLKGKSGADVTANMWLHLKANNLLPPIII